MDKKRRDLEKRIMRTFVLASAFSLTTLSSSIYFGIQHHKQNPYEQLNQIQYIRKQKESREIFYLGGALSFGILLASGIYSIRKCQEIN
ncbi:MAG: hypothetical protein Q7S56_02985 [Nanoarchaeota archaeon]|nr:hypothetical protein [Nanoarchaeota archaeon]